MQLCAAKNKGVAQGPTSRRPMRRALSVSFETLAPVLFLLALAGVFIMIYRLESEKAYMPCSVLFAFGMVYASIVVSGYLGDLCAAVIDRIVTLWPQRKKNE